jgi:hypothetical protein
MKHGATLLAYKAEHAKRDHPFSVYNRFTGTLQRGLESVTMQRGSGILDENRASGADRSHLGPSHPGSKAMKRLKRDPVREDRIHNEAIVDASPEEQAMSWYYYLDGKINFPFRAKCLAANAVSPLRKGEAVEVLRMAVEDLCEHDMLVQIRWQGCKMAVPLSQLGAIDPDESTNEAIGDWHYWVAQGYCL